MMRTSSEPNVRVIETLVYTRTAVVTVAIEPSTALAITMPSPRDGGFT